MLPGKRIDFLKPIPNSTDLTCVDSQLPIDVYSDQFSPFQIFDCTLRTEFPGTIFRFPLRTTEQANVSRISKHAYTTEQMEQLLQQTASQAASMLLFLKNIESIEIYHWFSNTSSPTLFFSTCIDSVSLSSIRHNRFSLFSISDISDISSREVIDELSITSTKYDIHQQQQQKYQQQFNDDLTTDDQMKVETINEQWLVVQKIGGETAMKIALDEQNKHLKLLPLAGVAAKIKQNNQLLLNIEEQLLGQIFCFLPLPIQTGFPVHINGYFELSSNRRDVS